MRGIVKRFPGVVANDGIDLSVDQPVFGEISAYDLFMTRFQQLTDPGVTFDPFEGPIYDRKGNLEVPAGMWLSVDSLININWAVDGVVGPWPGEPE